MHEKNNKKCNLRILWQVSKVLKCITRTVHVHDVFVFLALGRIISCVATDLFWLNFKVISSFLDLTAKYSMDYVLNLIFHIAGSGYGFLVHSKLNSLNTHVDSWPFLLFQQMPWTFKQYNHWKPNSCVALLWKHHTIYCMSYAHAEEKSKEMLSSQTLKSQFAKYEWFLFSISFGLSFFLFFFDCEKLTF